MFRPSRRQPEPPPVESFDLGALAAQRARQQAEATAAAMSKVPPAVTSMIATARTAAPDPLELILDRPLPPRLPPLDLVEVHDAELAQLMTRAVGLDQAARRLAGEYSEHKPGGAAFRSDLDACTTVASIEWLVTTGQSKRFAQALMARRVAERADDDMRTYAARAGKLRSDLTAEAGERAQQIKALFERCAETKKRRDLDDAEEACGPWRDLLALREWTASPRYPYRPFDERMIPKVAKEAHVDALQALGEEINYLSEGQMEDGVLTGGAWPVGTST